MDNLLLLKTSGYTTCLPLLVYQLPPFVLNISGNADNARDVGLEVIIMKTLANVLNFTEVYIPHNFTSWAASLRNGSSSQMLDAMYHRQADVIFGLVPSVTISADFDTTTIHIREGLTWWVPVAREEPGWKNLLLVFQPIVWVGCWSCFVLNAVIWWVIGRNKERSHHFSTLLGTLFANTRIGLQCVIPQPRSNVMRFLFMGSTLCSMLMYTAHQSQLIGSLTTPRYGRQITTVEELLRVRLVVWFQSSCPFFKITLSTDRPELFSRSAKSET
ncbi:Ionotropic receptor 60a [Carabus blaptoides fortunei]